MNPLTYSLCKKPVIGIVMFVTSLCAFPPPFYAEPLPLQRAGASLVKEFEAPVSKSYFLELGFTYPSSAAVRSDPTEGIPIHVLVRAKTNGAILIDKVFEARGIIGGTVLTTTMPVARIDLAAGRYVIEARNMKSQPGLDGVQTTLSLVAGHGK
jgi:hypothetical protein